MTGYLRRFVFKNSNIIWIILFISSIHISCVERTNSESSEDINLVKRKIENFERARKEDSLRVLRFKEREKKVLEFNKKGIVGTWKTSRRGYETSITISKEQADFIATITFLDSKNRVQIEKLRKDGNYYFIVESKVGEYYKINNQENLEIWDNQGLFITGNNILSSTSIYYNPTFEIENVLGSNIFNVAAIYSKNNPTTLAGSDNDIWIVYYSDMNTTFKVKKSTMDILAASKGKNPNFM